MEYAEFIKHKTKQKTRSEIIIDKSELNKILFEFQKDTIQAALKNGVYAIFHDCGLGKTYQQIEWARIVLEKNPGKSILIVAPLAVNQQTINEGKKIKVKINRLDCAEDYKESGIYITNYERIDSANPDNYIGLVLDESSIIKNFSGKIRNKIKDMFGMTKYKLFCTATPSPNDYEELGNHSELLGVMPLNEMKSRWFINDLGDTTAAFRLKKHAEKDFWSWVSSWASCISNPNDLGYDIKGFKLPKLNIIENIVNVDHTTGFDSGFLFRGMSVNASNISAESKNSIKERIEKLKELVNKIDKQIIIWVNYNYEADEIRKAIPEVIEVKGSDSIEYKEKNLIGFAENKFRILLTKPKIAQFGLNYQNCYNQIFFGLNYSFESLYQAIRRSYRFGQKNEVNINIIVSDAELQTLKTVKRKMKQFAEMQDKMIKSVNYKEVTKKMEIKKQKSESGIWEYWQGDSCQLIKEIKDNTIDLSVYSPPFVNLYVYSDSQFDMSNNNEITFFEHYKYLINEKFRITRPGRLSCVHCSDIMYSKERDGWIAVNPLSDKIIQAHQESGWLFYSRITIWKNPAVEMQRTKALGLLHKQIKKDSSKCRAGLPDYILVFKKPEEIGSYYVIPIEHSSEDLPVDKWREYASPVWMDINQSNTLNYRIAKDDKDEKHMCPLQLDVIERCIHLWSNKKELIFSPFGGIASEGYQAVIMDRKYIGIELKESYYQHGITNLIDAEREKNQGSLFNVDSFAVK